jgi:queuine tRNA-ribosyltransferase
MLGPQLATLQNLSLYSWLMQEARTRIMAGSFSDWWRGAAETLERRL